MGDPTLLHELAQHLDAAGVALQQAAEVVEQIAGTPVPPEPPIGTVITVTTPAELDAALAAANAGDVIRVDPSLRYLSPLAITATGVTVQNLAVVSGRATRAALMPRFADGLHLAGDDVHVRGIEIMKIDPSTDIVTGGGANCVLDGCRMLGDPIHGAKRGVAGNAPNFTLINSYVDDCFGPMPGNDTQAFCAWDSPGPFLIENNYLCGGAETVLFGGADPSSAANVPSNIVVRGNTITKNPAWRDKAIIKNLVEFKNARTYLVEDNDLSNCWGGEQGGYAFMITPRNQDGSAPYSEVKDGIIRNNRVSHVGAVLSLLGSDNIHPSGPLDGLVFEDNDCVDVDHVAYNGNDKVFLAQRGPLNVTIDGNKVAGPKTGSALYFGEAPNACVNFNFQSNTVPPSEYGVMGASCAPDTTLNNAHGSAWTTYVTSGTISGNVATA